MRKADFTINVFQGLKISGYTNDEDWNGWACPYFTFDNVGKIVEAHTSTGQKAWFDEANDQFIFEIDDEAEVYQAINHNGQNLYPIGNGVWIWE